MSTLLQSIINGNVPAIDSLVSKVCPDYYWVGSFEDDITELGIRAARWAVEENDGYGIELMLKDMVYALREPTPSQHIQLR